MNSLSNSGAAKAKAAIFLSLSSLLATGYLVQCIASGQADQKRFAGPASSQPLALSADGRLLVVANPDNDTVSVFDVQYDRNRRLAEVKVQSEPNGVVVSPDGAHAYVANTASGTVSVLRINPGSKNIARVIKHIPVGAEPYGVAMTPNGDKVYVTNTRSNSVSVISTRNYRVIKTIQNSGFEPRGIAITNNGDSNDEDETVYVSQFLALPAPGKLNRFDGARNGLVTVIAAADDTVKATVNLQPIAGAHPHQLNNIAIKGNFVFVPATGVSPDTQSLLAVFDRETYQSNPSKPFITVPWAIGFKTGSNEGYVVSAASNIVVKIKVDPATGQATVQKDLDPTRVVQMRVGKNPRGIVVNAKDTRAYVMNYISHDVTILDLTLQREWVMATMASADIPVPETSEDKIHTGKELFNTSRGEFDAPAAGKPAVNGRMSNNDWGY